MKLLDLFCGAGGAAKGYYRAGFTTIVGVDIMPQPNYPFQFVQGDALEYLAEHGREFDAVHASPPCQAHTALKSLYVGTNYRDRHPDMIPETRRLLREQGRPFVMENVMGAPLQNPVMLCGTHFGLKVYRHRLFEIHPVELVHHCYRYHRPHHDNCPGTGRGTSAKGFISVTGNGGLSRRPFGKPDHNGMVTLAGHFAGVEYARTAMGIDWMSRAELSQAIPPAYTEHIGHVLVAHLVSVATGGAPRGSH